MPAQRATVAQDASQDHLSLWARTRKQSVDTPAPLACGNVSASQRPDSYCATAKDDVQNSDMLRTRSRSATEASLGELL